MESAFAADGTKIPVIVLMKKGTKLDGKNPTILNGYGSYGISNVPTMNIYVRPWFDRGGVFAIANIRGGGEFGEPWHRVGALTKKETRNIQRFYLRPEKTITEWRPGTPKK
jgi:prolyl oligopeptidase